MNISLTAGLGALTGPAPQAGKTAKAARDFESVLLTPVFDALQKSFAFDAEDETPGASDYRLMGTRALVEAVSNGGGIGIGRLILRHLGAHQPSRESVEKG